MRRLGVLSAVLALGLIGSTGTVLAMGGADRSCVGGFVSAEAQSVRPLGAVVVSPEAHAFQLGPAISTFGTTCVLDEP